MDLARFCRHIVMSPLVARGRFTPATLDALQAQVTRCEEGHRGELRFVVEAELTTAQLWRDLSSRDRAREVFALQGVWNTAENNGVLIYLLPADRRVEIVAARGIAPRGRCMGRICRMMESHYREGSFEQGSPAGISGIALLAPLSGLGRGPSEREDRPALI